MISIDEVHGACHVDEFTGCWLWAGAKDRKTPKIWAPDWSRDGILRSQVGRRAVWNIQNPGAVLPSGWRVFGTCRETMCVNPEHSQTGPTAKWGQQRAKNGLLKGDVRRSITNRKLGRERSALTAEMFAEVMLSDESNIAVARRMDVSKDVISKARRGKTVCFTPIGGIFSGLLEAA